MATNEPFRELSELPELSEISVNFSIFRLINFTFNLKPCNCVLRMIVSLDFEQYS